MLKFEPILMTMGYVVELSSLKEGEEVYPHHDLSK